MGLVVENSYESDFFGYSYVTETHYNRDAWGSTDAKAKKTDGVYMFDPKMSKCFNKDANGNLVSYGAYTGKLTNKITCNVLVDKNGNDITKSYIWGRDDESNYFVYTTDGTPIPKYNLETSPSRLCADKEGYVYVCENVPGADRTDKLFRMDPKNPSGKFAVVLTKAHIEAADKIVGKTLPKRILSATVAYDDNGNKLLWTILGTESKSLVNNTVCLCAFNIND